MHSKLHHPAPYPADEVFENLRQRLRVLLDDGDVSRWALLRAEWAYDVALLANDFRLWMQHLDRSFDAAR
ncbi:hypothetical protein RCCGEPOP_23062 [Rhizobium sp. Pop5]|nr:hypothetical protein RCCGEPOP_23062 [Rhizobium sp. Pop5]